MFKKEVEKKKEKKVLNEKKNTRAAVSSPLSLRSPLSLSLAPVLSRISSYMAALFARCPASLAASGAASCSGHDGRAASRMTSPSLAMPFAAVSSHRRHLRLLLPLLLRAEPDWDNGDQQRDPVPRRRGGADQATGYYPPPPPRSTYRSPPPRGNPRPPNFDPDGDAEFDPYRGGGGGGGGGYNGNGNGNGDRPPPPSNNTTTEPGGMSNLTKAFVTAAFVAGIGTGTWFNSTASFAPSNVASTEIVDRKTPNSGVCMANGYSSMVFDQRIFVSFNPFNVYVAQPEVKPGCVLRRSNVGLLERKGLVTKDEVSKCTGRLNTFGFVNAIDGVPGEGNGQPPKVSCLYHSEDGENAFLSKETLKEKIGVGGATSGGGGRSANNE